MIRHRHRILLLFISCPVVFSASVFGDLIPSTTKSSTGPATFQSQIQGVINNAAKELTSADPAALKHGRDLLIYESESHAGASASPQFQSLYAADVVKSLSPFTKPTVPLRTRLNIAVVTREIAIKTYKNGSSDQLAPLVQAALSDKQEPVVLWGLKAARYVIPAVAANAGNTGALSKLVVQACKAHGDSGPIIEEAYSSLVLEPSIAGSILPDLLSLLEWRTQQYQGGASNPPSTLAEQAVTVFLSVPAFSAVNANPALRDRSLKDVAEFSCAVLHAFAAGNSNADLIEMIRAAGSAVNALGKQLQNNDLQAAGDAIAKTGPNTPANQVTASCDALAAALRPMNININPVGAAAGLEPALAGSGK